MMMSGKGKISAAVLMAVMDGIIASDAPVSKPVCEIDDLVRQDIDEEADAEALRKAQAKRDRKAAKRIQQSRAGLA